MTTTDEIMTRIMSHVSEAGSDGVSPIVLIQKLTQEGYTEMDVREALLACLYHDDLLLTNDRRLYLHS
jgi:hypothetical protein